MANAAKLTEKMQTMRKIALLFLWAASVAIAAPVMAQTDLGDARTVISQSLINQELKARRLNTVRSYRSYLT